jgi:hypothetical protein
VGPFGDSAGRGTLLNGFRTLGGEPRLGEVGGRVADAAGRIHGRHPGISRTEDRIPLTCKNLNDSK